jgi:hypothetical protein
VNIFVDVATVPWSVESAKRLDPHKVGARRFVDDGHSLARGAHHVRGTVA